MNNPTPGIPGTSKTAKEPTQMSMFDPHFVAPGEPETPAKSPFSAPKEATPPPTPAAPAGLPGGPGFSGKSTFVETFEEDFTDEDGSGGFKLAEEGYHPAKVIDFEKSVSKSGNPTYVWQFVITAGPSAGVEVRFWTSLLPSARWKAVEALEAVGIPASGSIVRFTKADIVNRPCILEIVHEEYDGKDSHKIEKVHPANPAAVAAAKQYSTPSL